MQTNPPAPERWRFWIDRGGTFTDVVGRAPCGALITRKLLSDNPEQYADAAIEGIRQVLDLPADAPLPSEAIEHVKMGTTVATNALLERRGAPTVLVITRGFGDALIIGHQARPAIFARHIQRPEPLPKQVIEAAERIGADGTVIEPLDTVALRADLQTARLAGCTACAIGFMHGYRYPEHERRAAEIARAVGFEQISLSHQSSPLMRLISRADTTVVDTYLSPVLRRYADQVAGALGDTPLLFMKSDGGLTDHTRFAGKDAILSGPAGGIVASAVTGQQAGFRQVIGFDMGGTSTDVSHYAGELERALETVTAGVRLRVPMLQIHTVAAGGGSICHFDGQRYRVGPDSAGADPGPACYRRGGPLTVTDCNVMLGRLQPDFFPAIFGPNADEPLDVEIVRERFTELTQIIREATGDTRSPEAVAQGFLDIAIANMANAIKVISVEKGHDLATYALNAFGGAAGQHACGVADALGMSHVLIHPLAGVLSAYGMGLADMTATQERDVNAPLTPETLLALQPDLSQLDRAVRAALIDQGADPATLYTRQQLHVKYAGTNTILPITVDTPAACRAAFEAAYRQQFGYSRPGKSLVIEAASVEAIAPGETLPEAIALPFKPATPLDTTTQIAVFDREALAAGQTLEGPVLVRDPVSTVVVDPGWRLTVTSTGALRLDRVAPRSSAPVVDTTVDPVLLEVFNNRFMSIAEQMGVTLQKTATSTNIKERLDFSCALFDPAGQLVANAPHVPVHLGSMGASVQAVIERFAQGMASGDVFMLNDPYHGGTHLPDITVVTPVFKSSTGVGAAEVVFYIASRAHHADVGGITPGSMPPASRRIEDEGVVIRCQHLLKQGEFDEAAVATVFRQGPYPSRNVEQNLADLQAQIAANAKGVSELHSLISHYGLAAVHAYMGHVQANAKAHIEAMLSTLPDGNATMALDNGAHIQVAIRVDRAARRACIDFTGTSAEQPDNFNAPLAITRAAVIYVLRTLVDDAIPLNEGCLEPIELIIPPGTLLNPRPPAAVVAGNVEVSQLVTDALYAALGQQAAAQGTMNNFTFGNAQYQHYETIAGGSGAGPDHPGTSAVQTHMTNSRLTDPEVLENRFPVQLEAFAIRHGSGGNGRMPGGDGAIRRLRFLEPMTAAILASRRRVSPPGLAGGEDGARGRQWVERNDGSTIILSGTDEVTLQAGEVFVIETPGGGGYGR